MKEERVEEKCYGDVYDRAFLYEDLPSSFPVKGGLSMIYGRRESGYSVNSVQSGKPPFCLFY
jgi:hypothetical protein